ncbi:TIGR03619 family F420-dependent LLM class oxidoreductase [Catenuloplanes sp. NPDC051500]|uniref:TIGR03619 family F420-dependent LLM class oxidoreductase n=1 Tax=Catenuloplanes sp. NPDC051500 TaxID=3363959 RepID=UPI00379D3981
MRFGINVPNFGPSADPARLHDWCVRLEETGFHSIMMSDHVAVTPDVARLFPAPFYDPLTTLAWLAGITRTAQLGTTALILPYRHPLQTARVTATLDQLSGGRLILGVAAGWAPQEFAALGLDYARRGELMDEHLEALTRLWTQELTSYRGRFVNFENVRTAPRPVRRRPPLWIGGHSQAAMRRAVQHGTAWHPTSLTMPDLVAGVSRLAALADRLGRPTPETAPRIKLRLTDAPLGDHQRLAGEGTPDQIHSDLVRLRELGIGHVVLDTAYPGVPFDEPRHWKAVRTLTEQLADLPRQALR